MLTLFLTIVGFLFTAVSGGITVFTFIESRQHKMSEKPMIYSGIAFLILLVVSVIIVIGSSFLSTAYVSRTPLNERPLPLATLTAPTASPQPDLTATVTQAYSLYAQSTSGAPLIKAPLTSQAPGPWGKDIGPDSSCRFTPQDYRIATLHQGFQICFAEGTTLTDFTFQVQLTIIRGDRGGMVFRITPSQNSVDAYYFEITAAGEYRLFWVRSNVAYPLASDTSPLLKSGLNQPNLLTAIVRGSTIILFINKQYVITVRDTTYHSGLIGLIAHSTMQQATEIAFSNAEVWTAS